MSLRTRVAIDGPAGAGKSTISKQTARDLGLVYVDTGAMYRAVALFALQKKTDPSDSDAVIPLLDDIHIDLKYIDGVQKIYLNGSDVSEEIRREEVGKAASAVSAIAEVRGRLVDMQRDIASEASVIMDGRDIGTCVLPDAQLKIYLTASPEERAERRYNELLKKGESVSFEKILEDIKQRDYNDMHREASPLKKADDAVVLDTTGYTLEESIAAVKRLVEEAREKAK